jgi:hypothetical protein
MMNVGRNMYWDVEETLMFKSFKGFKKQSARETING